jgi:GTPase KRas
MVKSPVVDNLLALANSSSDTLLEAQQRSVALEETVQTILGQNRELLRRLEQFDFMSGTDSGSMMFGNEEEGSTVRRQPATLYSRIRRDPSLRPGSEAIVFDDPSSTSTTSVTAREFEITLEESRVYKRIRSSYNCDLSFTTSIPRTHAWSQLTGLSLNDVSVMSVIALPVSIDEINSIGAGLTFADFLSSHSQSNPIRNSTPRPPVLESDRMSLLSHSNLPEAPVVEVDSSSVVGTDGSTAVEVDQNPTPKPEASKSRVVKMYVPQWSKTQPTPRPPYRIVVLGASNIKAALMAQVCIAVLDPHEPSPYAKQPVQFRSHFGDSYLLRQHMIDGMHSDFEVVDNLIQEEYLYIDEWIANGDGFLIVYSVTSLPSFDRALSMVHQVERIKEARWETQWYLRSLQTHRDQRIRRWLPTRLTPTKSTMTDSNFYVPRMDPMDPIPVVLVGTNSNQVHEREVTLEGGQARAQELGCEFLEISSTDDQDIEKAFYDVVRQIRRQKVKGRENQRPGTR